VKTAILCVIVAAQVLLLAVMATQREWVLRTGHSVYLRTRPVDPDDPMRGEYARLRYDFSRVTRDQCRARLAEAGTNYQALPADTRVYATLQQDENGVAEFVSLTSERPSTGLYLRGRTQRTWGNTLNVRYGLEAFFTEQGRSKVLERPQAPDSIQIPLEMRAMVNDRGLAVLKDYRYCSMGIGLIFETNTAPATNSQTPRVVALTARLYNSSSNDLAVVDLPAGRSLTLLPDRQNWSWPGAQEPPPSLATAKVIILKPGQVHSIRLDFNDPHWALLQEHRSEKPQLLNDLSHEWSAQFQVAYCPPLAATTSNLPNAGLIWHGKLVSRPFRPAGGVD
jgi:uncharacterized membrane-anchored protein